MTDESNLEEKAFIPISKFCTSRLSKFEISDKLERASVRLSHGHCFDDISTYHSIANVIVNISRTLTCLIINQNEHYLAVT